MFESSHLFFIILGCLSTCIFLLVCLRPYLFPKQKFFARPVITNFETQMFIRLKQSFPSYHVLAQVAFSALITSNDYKVRSQFNRKVTDFVLLDENMEVIAIIELDDPTHLEKVEEDRLRDQMLIEAGYIVRRYTNIPSVRQLQKIFIKNYCYFLSELAVSFSAILFPFLNAAVHIVSYSEHHFLQPKKVFQ